MLTLGSVDEATAPLFVVAVSITVAVDDEEEALSDGSSDAVLASDEIASDQVSLDVQAPDDDRDTEDSVSVRPLVSVTDSVSDRDVGPADSVPVVDQDS